MCQSGTYICILYVATDQDLLIYVYTPLALGVHISNKPLSHGITITYTGYCVNCYADQPHQLVPAKTAKDKKPNVDSAQFGILLTKILKELTKNEADNLEMIKSVCSTLTTDDESNDLYFNEEQLKKIDTCSQLRTLFVHQLRGLWRWDDFPLLIAIVQPFGSCQEMIQNYKSKLCSEMQLKHIYEHCKQENLTIPDGYDKMVAIIKNRNFYEITLQEYHELKQFTSRHCGVKSYVICPFCKADSHSLLLEWYIPFTAVKHMVDTAGKNIHAFTMEGFIYLKISETEILNTVKVSH